MNLAIIGTGYVGLVTGTCLAEVGHRVICQDHDREKIRVLEEGGLPIYEPYLGDLVAKNSKEGRLTFTLSPEEAVRRSDVIFICVGTPPLEDGEADLSAVEKVTRTIAKLSTSPKLIVEKSTVPVQTGMWIKRTLQIYNPHTDVEFDVVSNPEFLREGTAVEDFLHPDRIVIGVESIRAEKLLRELYSPILTRSFNCPIHRDCQVRRPVPLLVTDINSAELIKHASNSFLATKISFINAIADICEKTGADITKVAYGMGLDPRIGKSFLNAGIGFGGFCFPKDLQAFVKIAEKLGYDFSLLREAERINEKRIDLFINKMKDRLWILKGKVIGVLGLSFKPDTDDIRFAPSIKIIERLTREHALIKVYDPQAMEKAKHVLPHITYCQDPYETADRSDALLFLTEWKEFLNLNFSRIKGLLRRPLILDGRNMLDKERLTKLGFEYVGVGR